jgi:hypothetical protein
VWGGYIPNVDLKMFLWYYADASNHPYGGIEYALGMIRLLRTLRFRFKVTEFVEVFDLVVTLQNK